MAEAEIQVASFYRFVALPDAGRLQPLYLDRCRALGLKGTILLAPEGINANLAGSPQALSAFLAYLAEDPRLAKLEVKYADSATLPFGRMKVKLKREIITLNQADADPTRQVGIYVEPADWNSLISQADVTVLDTRNSYETAIGRFQGAVDPATEDFRGFPEYVSSNLDPQQHKRVALYCTGGIRCEKATAWMLAQGFAEVYHLAGGILKYLEEIPPEQSLWQGECFVFDARVAVEHGLQQGSHSMCQGCGGAVSAADLQHPEYEAGVCCPSCGPHRTPAQKAAFRKSWQQRLRAKS